MNIREQRVKKGKMSVLAKNKRAYYDYEILESYQAGIVLTGQEVKSAKKGRCSIRGSYAKIKSGEVFLLGAVIPPYQPANAPSDYNPQRRRKLLLRKGEIEHLEGKTTQKGLTLVPLKVYTKGGLVKVQIGLARGKKTKDKREKIKRREAERRMRRALKKENR